MLVVENLLHCYAGAPVLQIANLRINRNERRLVAGASGSGKQPRDVSLELLGQNGRRTG
jgi:energy-coupling factor transporter ATP-binding protein EcfA2